jgi:hypothetical protein
VDTKVDAALDELQASSLKGKPAIANAKIAYESFRRMSTLAAARDHATVEPSLTRERA